MNRLFPGLLLAILVVAAMAGAYFMLVNQEFSALFFDVERIVFRAQGLGTWGPLLFIGLMVLAIVFNPLPSAPIAVAAGTVYGHTLGTVYVVVGAEIGALLAFLIARLLGAVTIQRLIGKPLSLGRFNSQNSLTAIVFVSRLVPFMSFDLVSYAAGLTAIHAWRFALATLLGLIPISFALAHLGSEINGADESKLLLLLLLLGLVVVLPLGAASWYRAYREKRSAPAERID